MASNYPIDSIPAAAVSEVITDGSALIVDSIGIESHLLSAIGELYPYSCNKLYYTKPGINKLPLLLRRLQELSIPGITLCGAGVPLIEKTLPKEDFTASLISPSLSLEKGSLESYLLGRENLKELSVIGYQSYRTDPNFIKEIYNRNFEEIRLGLLREEISLAEPLIRDKEYLFLDLRAIRSSDFSTDSHNLPNGLYAEEVCQLARYLGMGQNIKQLFIFGIPAKTNATGSHYKLLAEIIWHFTEALSANIIEEPWNLAKGENFLKKTVSLGAEGGLITFVCSRSSGRWWLEVPDIKNSITQYVPCSKADYSTACAGEIPNRWLFFFQKINHI